MNLQVMFADQSEEGTGISGLPTEEIEKLKNK